MERKLATVLFADLVDSTEFVSGSDPEVVRRRVTSFFEQVATCIERHGGTVEKFAGDAVMAAFGVPRAHEDDAERAVRAGLAVLERLKELGVAARVGVEAGEVVVDDSDSTFATGEAVNVAARLQQAAKPNELLIGPMAHRLTAGAFDTEAAGPLVLRGFRDPLPAFRVVCAADYIGRRAPLAAAPFVGRDAELELLENTFSRAERDRRPHIVTIFGEPGVGKSRLAREFVEGLEGATVFGGRCLPYGEGITYWPLAEMVKASAGISDDDPMDVAEEKLKACCEDEVVADLLGLAAGVLEAVEAERGTAEIAWAAREWAEKLAEVQPLVLVFEDIHWAEEPLLELIDHLATWVRQRPLMLLCLARPELLDVRPDWGGGRVRATAVELEALARDESEELVDALLAEHELPLEVRARLLEKTEGNPLFVEETIRMLVEGGASAERIPDTIQALIAARIDRLPQGEKLILQRASVIGRIFWGGAVAHLSPDLGDDVDELLDDLLLRDFVVPERRSTITGEEAFRFKHVLIREVAYAGVTKTERADHHTRFASWLAEAAGEELLEIRAYHLDHACSLLAELDGAPPVELAAEAAAALEGAGRRALAREANASARKLLRRAVELEPTLERRYSAARAAWRLDDLPTLAKEMEALARDAEEAGDSRILARALTALAEATLFRDADVPKALGLAERALDAARDADELARFGALDVRSRIAWWQGHLDEAEGYERKALEVARAARRKDLESKAALELAILYMARMDDDEAAPLLERALELAEASGSLVARAHAAAAWGEFLRFRGDSEGAEVSDRKALELYTEAGAAAAIGHVSKALGRLAWENGDLPRAEKLLRESIRQLTPLQDRGTLCESQRLLAQLLLERGRVDDAEQLALAARETVGPEDMTSRATTRVALAQVRAAQGLDADAETLFREALDIVAPSQFRRVLFDVLPPYAEFLRARGRDAEADELERTLPTVPDVAESAARIA